MVQRLCRFEQPFPKSKSVRLGTVLSQSCGSTATKLGPLGEGNKNGCLDEHRPLLLGAAYILSPKFSAE